MVFKAYVYKECPMQEARKYVPCPKCLKSNNRESDFDKNPDLDFLKVDE